MISDKNDKIPVLLGPMLGALAAGDGPARGVGAGDVGLRLRVGQGERVATECADREACARLASWSAHTLARSLGSLCTPSSLSSCIPQSLHSSLPPIPTSAKRFCYRPAGGLFYLMVISHSALPRGIYSAKLASREACSRSGYVSVCRTKNLALCLRGAMPPVAVINPSRQRRERRECKGGQFNFS